MGRTSSPSPVLTCSNLTAGYGGAPVVRSFNTTLLPGSCLTLLGPNGCGKSTVLRSLVGLATIISGSATIDGRQVGAIPRHRLATLGVGYVPQGRGDFPSLTVEENLRLACQESAPRAVAEHIRRVFEAIPMLALLRTRRVRALSGGERTLAALGRALMLGPNLRLLLLDEISAGLSPANLASVASLLRRLCADGTAMLLVEQHESFAQMLGFPVTSPERDTRREFLTSDSSKERWQ